MVASWRDREQRKREAAASRGPVSRGQRVRGGRPYFLFLRWILVFFSSLRCFFFAILLRRFLMTEPIRPPLLLAQRQTGTPSHSPGREAGHRPEVRIRANAYRPRSAQAYLVSHSGVTAWPPTRHRRPGPPPGVDGGPGGRIGQNEMPAEHLPPGAAAVPVYPRSAASGSAQPVPT